MGSTLGGGSSESTSYGYLPYVSPGASQIIGQYQANAANSASQIAQKQLSDAMASITSNFTSARTALNPYSQQGVQATDKLNQYLGLDAYNPGAAPTAPTAYKPSDTEIRNYIQSNISYTPAGGDNNIYSAYGGVGAKYDGWSKNVKGGSATGLDLLGNKGVMVPGQGDNPYGSPRSGDQQDIDKVFKDAGTKDQISKYLTNQYNDNNKDLITANQTQYQQDLQNYNQNLAWYNQYHGEGSKTASQIQNEVTNQPGYQAQLDEGTGAIQKAASARGLLGSGNMLKDLTSFAGNLEGQYYQNMLGNLQQQASVGANAASQQSQSYQSQGGALANLRSQLSDSLGNAALAKGQALASAYQLGNTTYNKVVTGQSSSSSGGGLSGIGSIIGAASGFLKP